MGTNRKKKRVGLFPARPHRPPPDSTTRQLFSKPDPHHRKAGQASTMRFKNNAGQVTQQHKMGRCHPKTGQPMSARRTTTDVLKKAADRSRALANARAASEAAKRLDEASGLQKKKKTENNTEFDTKPEPTREKQKEEKKVKKVVSWSETATEIVTP